MADLKKATENIKARLRSPRGRSFLTFLTFLGISTILWFVLVINDEVQRDVRCSVKITHKPDSVTVITELPEAINVSVKAKSSVFLKQRFAGAPSIDIDYLTFRRNNRITIGGTEIRGILRGIFGATSQVLNVTPDSINLVFTTRKPVRLPVRVDAKTSISPQYILNGPITPLTDSVDVYSSKPLPSKITCVYTEPVRYDNLEQSTVVKAKLIAPAGTRVIPGEVEVKIPVEPLISKSRKVIVTTRNVPQDISMSTFPPVVEVSYMVPMSLYNSVSPDFVIEADYRDIRHGHNNKIPLHFKNIPVEFHNVCLSEDSVEYVIERH